jgi:5'(3')-deoxyribonucleotidase
MKPLILGVDVDDTVADFSTEWIRRYNLAYGDNLTVDDVLTWDIDEYTKKCSRNQLFEILREPDFYEHVSPLPRAREGIYKLLAQGHRVVYVTSCTEGTVDQKRDWLLRWGFLTRENKYRDFIAANDKALIGVDVLFDDRVDNVLSFPGKAMLIRSPANLRDTRTQPLWTLLGMYEAPYFLHRI